jgi:thioredoxin-related protein
MKNKLIKVLVAGALAAGLAGSSTFASLEVVRWYGYQEGLTKAKSENKKIFLNFNADWCTYCKKMENETFKNASVVSFLNANFIPITVNSDKESKIAADFRVKELPTNWFLSEHGKRISRLPGFVSARDLLPLLKYIQSDSYKKMSYAQFLKNI